MTILLLQIGNLRLRRGKLYNEEQEGFHLKLCVSKDFSFNSVNAGSLGSIQNIDTKIPTPDQLNRGGVEHLSPLKVTQGI